VNAARKLWVPLSGQLSPARGSLIQLGYTILFGPINALVAVALWRHSRPFATHALFVCLLGSFLLTTAIFWAHTSHKSFLDVFLFVYAAGAFTSSRSSSY
jgi:hypothetical protein